MPYTNNPYMPRLRRDAALYAYQRGVRAASRRFGIPAGTICKWLKKFRLYGNNPIPTQSSRPKSHPKQLPREVVQKIIDIRIRTKRTSEVVHAHLKEAGVAVSINTVRRVIDQAGLMKKKSPWKRYHPPVDRPYPVFPGALVETDTVHRMVSEKKRIYVFTLIDVYSRWAYAKAYERMNAATAVRFLAEAQKHAGFHFQMVQSDHGPEFGMWFVSRIQKTHRYTRIGKPNDNAHIERFNRTIQEECLDRVLNDVRSINCALRKYLKYYNHERLHLGIELCVPNALIR